MNYAGIKIRQIMHEKSVFTKVQISDTFPKTIPNPDSLNTTFQ
jgi:hypothetical protein